AQAIQGQILPARPAAVRGFELAGDYRTSGDVGGDYFDYAPMADGRMLVIDADVSGHNLASRMMMVNARATLRALAGNGSGGAHVLTARAGRMHQHLVRTEQFTTAAGVVLREGDRRVEIVNAGHNGILHYRVSDRAVRTIGDSSFILGFLPRVD